MNTCRDLRFLVLAISISCTGAASAADHAHHPDKLGVVHFLTSCGAEVQPSFDHAVALMHNFAFAPSNKVLSDALTVV